MFNIHNELHFNRSVVKNEQVRVKVYKQYKQYKHCPGKVYKIVL